MRVVGFGADTQERDHADDGERSVFKNVRRTNFRFFTIGCFQTNDIDVEGTTVMSSVLSMEMFQPLRFCSPCTPDQHGKSVRRYQCCSGSMPFFLSEFFWRSLQ